MKKNTLTAALLIRLNAEDAALLDAVAARLPVLSRAAIAREAMRIGLRQISADPACLIAPVPTGPPDPIPIPATTPTTEPAPVAEPVPERTKASPRPKRSKK